MQKKILKKKYNSINMMSWAKDLFPINRSITGKGVKQTIRYIQKNINNKFLNKKIKSNTKVYDWKIPKEWSLKNAYILDDKGNKICDFKWRGMPTLVRHRDEELLLSVSDPTKKSKVHVWPNPAHNPGETVICITKEGNIKFSRTNPNETDPDTGQKVDLFIFCSKKNTNQNTCKQNTKEKYQYKITWDKFTNLKIYKYNLKKDKWILQ